MKYNIGEFIILTSQPDFGIWQGIIAEIGDIQDGHYRIMPLSMPPNRPMYTTHSVYTNHIFSDNWIYHVKSKLLNTLLERS